LVSRNYQVDANAGEEIVGAGGKEILTFKAIGDEGCNDTIWAYYAQPWTFEGFDQAGKDKGIFD